MVSGLLAQSCPVEGVRAAAAAAVRGSRTSPAAGSLQCPPLAPGADLRGREGLAGTGAAAGPGTGDGRQVSPPCQAGALLRRVALG